MTLKHKAQEGTLAEADLIGIFESYHKKMYNYIYYRMNDSSVAEDLTSQVFEKMIINKHTYDKKKASIGVWLFTIAKNCINDYLRQQRKRKWAPLDVVLDFKSLDKSPEEVSLEKERNSKLHKALKILSERELHIIGLKFGAGLSNIEIAQMLSLSESNVGSILYRCMKKLKTELEREDVICLKKA